ncbi:MAG: uracil-xanthine permease family protein, partial [Enterobacterales bacterium]|nr:uracil-xanthine permease family protein [Enterobacterales bacterium]
QHIISMSLFASGLASILQIKTWGPVGSGLLSIQGTSFNFVSPLIMGGMALKNGGADIPTMMATLFGTLMLASCTEIILSRFLHLARRIITPLVSGVVVMIIGLSLIQVGLVSIGGGYSAMNDHTFGAPGNLMLAGSVLVVIILLNRQRNPYLRVSSLVIAMAVGYALAWAMGMLPDTSNMEKTTSLLMVPTPLYYGLGIDWNLLIPLMLVFMVTSLETIGDITATSDVSEQPVSGPLYMKRLKGGVLANGLNSMLSAVFNTFPNSCFGQNNGVIQLTGVASRYVGFVVALMLIVLGLFPAVAGFVQHIPEPVLGGATIVMFGTIAASGVRIVSREPLNRRAIMIMALSLAVGLGVSQQPLILQFAPDWMKTLLSSGIAAGGITAIVLNLVFPHED